MARETPHPFPVSLRDDVNHQLVQAAIVDENARFIVRRMIADAYAVGFADGHRMGQDDAWSDQRAKQDQPA